VHDRAIAVANFNWHVSRWPVAAKRHLVSCHVGKGVGCHIPHGVDSRQLYSLFICKDLVTVTLIEKISEPYVKAIAEARAQ
jgi:hypothetical protein